ncbi:uncharacterized protein LAESUDRAFT_736936 [Laetiporus sulphureus 93-53]|uniref:RRM domain-containing protein n=1 Tax=Laetiporus sulphureus 93-53 TaxID=1314785 RepID=A0A165E9C7_9APHY|nr:uncharacterized protein LAESUDRAFT_736936 [Laetiporus sulphureus 93-53]KZT06520.1 hypothetical protein LAESUDRAFT_736936 [Laetiporus sulphureus 93-53]
MQTQAQLPRPGSPSNNNAIPDHLKSAQSADPYGTGPQNTNTNSMYNSMNNIHLAGDYAPLSSTEPDALNLQSKINGFGATTPYRSSFNPFPPRSRHNTVPFGDTSGSFNNATYQTQSQSTDLYGIQNLQSPPPSSYAFDSMHHPGRAHDYTPVRPQGSAGLNGGVLTQGKQQSFSVEPFRSAGMESTLAQSQQINVQGSLSSALPIHQPGVQQVFQGPFANGMSHGLAHPHHGALASHAQFGPTLPTNGPGPGAVGGPGNSLTGASGMGHVNGSTANQQQEEISTIFVVGFPEDMQEREFQNMFTFSSGFEAATLKIPNKEYTAYGGAGATGPGSRMQYPGANDPYNLVTVNQGGVVVDGGRDGLTTSWPAPAPVQNDDGHFVPSNVQPPRKQIIGFAKFRTRQEALEARDILQGRRVDVERGAVLKAEMAKKNLHTKRGPGVPPSGPSNASAPSGGVPENVGGYPGLTSLAGLSAGTLAAGSGEALALRERELGGALGAMGIVGLGSRREAEDDRRRELAAVMPGMSLSSLPTRGARERAEEESERERKRKEKEAARMRQNSFAFEAFHSVPQQMVRQGANSLLSAESGALPGSSITLPSSPPMQSIASQIEGANNAGNSPWGNFRDIGSNATLRKMSLSMLSSNLSLRPTSPPQLSPPGAYDGNTSAPLSATSPSGSIMQSIHSAPFSPQSNSSSLPSHPSLPSRPRPFSPSGEHQLEQSVISQSEAVASSIPASSSSSVSGSQSGHEEELSRSVVALALNTEAGATSPQLPSPASGASSGTGRNPGDQNPPINTLYVGNLPTSPAPGGLPLSFLEDRLRDLFSKRPGYRKLCFRQKSNGPMCFVEFEDVNYATKALQELYGNTLNGLVKGGGIRLSYSKNPLGVRTPTGGANSGSSLQHQQGITIAQSIGDAFASRRDNSGMTSPTSYHYSMSPPPPRFISPPPPPAFPRSSPQGFGAAAGTSSSFSPFGISPSHSTIPDQPSADVNNDPLSHSMTSTPPNIEASRAG